MPLSIFEELLVPIRLTGEEEDSWVELTEELNHNNILFLCDQIETELSNEIMTLMMYLGMEDNTQFLYLFINSPGGDVINGIAIDNVMQHILSPVMTICLGIAASTATFILAGGAYKNRVALPHARIMIHQPYIKPKKDKDEEKEEEEEKEKEKKKEKEKNKKKHKKKDKDKDKDKESISQIYDEFGELLAIRETLAKGFSERTYKPLWIISQDMERKTFMSATEARDYGIVDRVGI